MEIPLFFESRPETLFGVLHKPDSGEPHAGLVLCHPFGEEKLWAHRVAVNLAREAVRHGHAAFRFDMRGHGDSGGSTEHCTPNVFLADIDAAITTFLRQCPTIQTICLLGLRFGATLAWLYANRYTRVDYIILMEPIINGSRYLQELLRINLATQLAVYGKIRLNRESLVEQMEKGEPVNVDGYLISAPFYKECNAIDMVGPVRSKSKSPLLVMQIAPTSSQKDNVTLKSLADANPDHDFRKVIEPPFWREIKPYTSLTKSLVREAIGWWEEHLGN